MGYSTDFFGKWALDKPLTSAHAAYLRQFNKTRRMKRDAMLVAVRPDPLRLAAKLPVGTDGEFFVGAGDDFGQEHSADVLKYNDPPSTQPGLWCQWVPTEDGTAIEWDGGEKFYDYVEWISYLIRSFLHPWGYMLNGEVEWHGEEYGDVGRIVITNNTVAIMDGDVVFSPRKGR